MPRFSPWENVGSIHKYMEFFASLSKTPTITALNISEVGLLVFAFLVVVGLFADKLLPWYHHRIGLAHWAVAIGCAGELIADGGVYIFSTHLQTIAEQELEAERNARIDIENRVAWRRLTPEQKREIGEKLRPLAGQVRAAIVYNTGDKEGEVFARDIAEALHQGNWDVNSPGSLTIFAAINQPYELTPPLATGVHVSAAPLVKPIVGAIVCELASRGFDAVDASDAPPSSVGPRGPADPHVLAINVDVRPEGAQGDAKLRTLVPAPTCP